jgi:hypothetical protein
MERKPQPHVQTDFEKRMSADLMKALIKDSQDLEDRADDAFFFPNEKDHDEG